MGSGIVLDLEMGGIPFDALNDELPVLPKYLMSRQERSG